MIWLHNLRKNQKGQSMVEFALLLPLIIILLFGILEFGRVFHSYLVITSAAREGARIGAVGRPDSEIIARIREAAPLPDADSKLKITRLEPNQDARTPGLPLTVEVTYDVDLITPLFSDILPNPITLRAESTMRLE
ncbi:MAG: pilus assembly protein [Desulfotomaculum sp.]|nr:pilus assembly protein [Desulfotomaculum sp.]